MTSPSKITLFDREVFNLFVRPAEVTEVRVIGARGKSAAWGGEYARGVVSGYFDDHNAFCDAVKKADKAQHNGVYFTLQVIDPRLIGRAFNRLKPATETTKDNNVLKYRWLPIDIDAVRPAGISASDSELAAAIKLRDAVAGKIAEKFGLPAPLKAVSGNGGHLLYKLPDLPVNEENTSWLKRILESLDKAYSTEKVKLDTTVYNPARIWKLYGTTARKGDAVPAAPRREARPHRMAYIDKTGEPYGQTRDNRRADEGVN